MDTNKLTTKSRDAVSAALRNALTAGNPNAEPAHLLHALLMVPGNTVAPLISAVRGDPAVVDAAAQGAIAKLPSASGSSVSQPALSGSFARVLADAENRADSLGDAFVATEHLLIALAAVESEARRILRDLKITAEALTRAFNDARGSKRVTSAEAEGTTSRSRPVRRGPHRAGTRGQARPGDRPRYRDPPRGPGARSPDQEQPGPDRRARRRQDGRRRGARAAAGRRATYRTR